MVCRMGAGCAAYAMIAADFSSLSFLPVFVIHSSLMVSPHFNSVRMDHVVLWSMTDFWWTASAQRQYKSMSHFRLTIVRIG